MRFIPQFGMCMQWITVWIKSVLGVCLYCYLQFKLWHRIKVTQVDVYVCLLFLGFLPRGHRVLFSYYQESCLLLDWIMWSICCSYQSKSEEQFCTASRAPQVILFMPGSELSQFCRLLQLQTSLCTLFVCMPTRRHLKNPEIASTGITNLK